MNISLDLLRSAQVGRTVKGKRQLRSRNPHTGVQLRELGELSHDYDLGIRLCPPAREYKAVHRGSHRKNQAVVKPEAMLQHSTRDSNRRAFWSARAKLSLSPRHPSGQGKSYTVELSRSTRGILPLQPKITHPSK